MEEEPEAPLTPNEVNSLSEEHLKHQRHMGRA